MSAKTNEVIEYDDDIKEYIRITYTNDIENDHHYEATSCIV